MTLRSALPRKTAGLHVSELDGEFVVVDDATQQAHALSGLAADLWRGIDAGTWPDATDEDLDAAVAELAALGLIEPTGLSRRMLLQRAGTVAIAGTVITIGLPTAQAAASHGVGLLVPQFTIQSDKSSVTGPETFTISGTMLPQRSHSPSGAVTLLQNGVVRLDVPADTSPGSFSFGGLTQTASSTYAVRYSGDTNFATQDSSTVSVNYVAPQVTKLDPTVTLSGTPDTKKSRGWTATVTVGRPAGNAVAPAPTTATITLTNTTPGGSPASATITAGAYTTNAVNGTVSRTFTVTNKSTDGGTVTLQAEYSGDANYNSRTITPGGNYTYTVTNN